MRECDVPMPPCSTFYLSPPLVALLLTRLATFAVAKATQVCSRNRTSPIAAVESLSLRDQTTRPPRSYGGARAIRDSPSDVGACHRAVRRHTCCSRSGNRGLKLYSREISRSRTQNCAMLGPGASLVHVRSALRAGFRGFGHQQNACARLPARSSRSKVW